MPEILIRIESADRVDIDGEGQFQRVALGEDIHAHRPILLSETTPIVIAVQFASTVTATVLAQVVGSWLYDKLKGKRVSRVTINRREVERLTAEGIERAVEETTELEH